MKYNLAIEDLSYVQSIPESSVILAGTAVAETVTKTGSGFAVAGAAALATGQVTRTNTNTLASVQYYGDLTTSYADAFADAYARTGYNTERASSYSTSMSFNSHSTFTTNV